MVNSRAGARALQHYTEGPFINRASVQRHFANLHQAKYVTQTIHSIQTPTLQKLEHFIVENWAIRPILGLILIMDYHQFCDQDELPQISSDPPIRELSVEYRAVAAEELS